MIILKTPFQYLFPKQLICGFLISFRCFQSFQCGVIFNIKIVKRWCNILLILSDICFATVENESKTPNFFFGRDIQFQVTSKVIFVFVFLILKCLNSEINRKKFMFNAFKTAKEEGLILVNILIQFSALD